MRKFFSYLTCSVLIMSTLIKTPLMVYGQTSQSLESEEMQSQVQDYYFPFDETRRGIVPEWAEDSFMDQAQNNKMFEIAWKDYQAVQKYINYEDLTEFLPGTHYQEILKNFEPSIKTEIRESRDSANPVSLLSYFYMADKGDINPETTIEDWAIIEFYFIYDQLVYTGVTTASINFQHEKAVKNKDHKHFIKEGVDVSEVFDYRPIELYSFGQVYSDGVFYQAISYPKTGLRSSSPLDLGILVIEDGTVIDGGVTTLDQVFETSASGESFGHMIFGKGVPHKLLDQEEESTTKENRYLDRKDYEERNQ